MTINERDELGGEEQDIAASQIIQIFESCGIVEICLDLISKGIQSKLQVKFYNKYFELVLRKVIVAGRSIEFVSWDAF
jgi:hypothetical protein